MNIQHKNNYKINYLLHIIQTKESVHKIYYIVSIPIFFNQPSCLYIIMNLQSHISIFWLSYLWVEVSVLSRGEDSAACPENNMHSWPLHCYGRVGDKKEGSIDYNSNAIFTTMAAMCHKWLKEFLRFMYRAGPC